MIYTLNPYNSTGLWWIDSINAKGIISIKVTAYI